ncbi:MAG: alanine racemase [Mariprofundaceae bacterium]
MQLNPRVEAAISWLASDKTVNAYIYDPHVMRDLLAGLARIMPEGVEIFYAMKANPHPAFLAAASEARGIEIASLGEAEKAVAAGFKPSHLIFTGPGKSTEELRWSVDQGVRTVHVESLTEAHRLQAICAESGKCQDVLLRVNANFDIHEAQTQFSGGSRKFGVDEETLGKVLPQLIGLDRLRFRGLHVYCASGVLNVADLLMNCKLVFDLVREIEISNPDVVCDIIDFGGGFGVDYLEKGEDFDPHAYADGLNDLIEEYAFQGRSFVLELGRYLAAPAGWFCTEILDIKESRGKKQLICAGGINHFRRPAALAINHPVTILCREQKPWFDGQVSVRDERVYIGGPLCTSADKLANDVYIEAADVGDVAVFGLAGAYGLSMSNIEFLSHRRPPEIVL